MDRRLASVLVMTQDTLPLVSVIVPVYGMDRQLLRLLACLADQSYPSERFECLIVDNHSQPKVAPPGPYPFPLKVLHEPRPGSYAARNRGVREAAGEILVFTDADCRPLPLWLQQAVRTWQEQAGRAIVAGHVSVEPEQPARWNGWCWYSMVNDLRQDVYVRKHGFAATANLAVAAGIFARVGEFNASLYSGGDLEWCLRAGRSGVPLFYAREVVVRHSPRAGGWETIHRMRRVVGGQYQLCSLSALHPLLSLLRLQARNACLCFRRNWQDPLYPDVAIRMQGLAISLLLRLVIVLELLRLSAGGQPLRS